MFVDSLGFPSKHGWDLLRILVCALSPRKGQWLYPLLFLYSQQPVRWVRVRETVADLTSCGDVIITWHITLTIALHWLRFRA